jgi:transposase
VLAHRGLAGVEKKARQDRLTIVFLDEAGFYLLPGVVRTYAPRAQTPILKTILSYAHLSVMGGITMAGRLYTLTSKRALTSLDSVRFLKHVRQQRRSKLLVVWDGSPIHRKEVTRFMADGGSRYIHLEQLPAYAPDLNPAEGVWQHLKHVELRNVCCKDLSHLGRELNLAIMRLRSKPQIIRSFFAGAGLSIKP